MPETKHSDGNHSKTGKALKHDSQSGLWLIAVVGIILIVGLLIVSVYHPNMAERVKFFTGNALNLLILAVIVFQAYIYRRQWEAMQEQLTAMHDQADSMRESLKETRSIVGQNQQAVEAARQGVEIAQQNMICAQRAYVTIASAEITSYDEATRIKVTRVGSTPFDEETPFRIRLKIENSGNTPANNVEVFHDFEDRESPPTPSKDASHWTKIGLIAPHNFVYFYGDWVRDDEINWEILEGRGTGIYCWGVLRYRDIFGHTRHTIFNYVQSPYTTSLGSLRPFYPSPSGGNEAE